MVLSKLATFLCDSIILRSQLRLRNKASPSYEVIASDVVLNRLTDGASSSSSLLGGSRLANEFEGESCCVCLSRLKQGDDMRVLPCLHRFHRACVDRWFNEWTKTCPLCRFSMGEEMKLHAGLGEVLTDEMVIWFSSFHVAGF
ncbi:hypothetical protein CICLE_v10027145mg [Citrus x clementina]|uniref:RING-type E3 ubiquitin transferase n=1 Tax=Citrus clementina TaxID=85681 RepID=V4RV75_CITCL|nr:E3 ubiquitin-protein ligase RHA2A [Citrus x clementina]ESR38628.1 hypothetical protein CICLE_v10027145mg [Citrus x clementina]